MRDISQYRIRIQGDDGYDHTAAVADFGDTLNDMDLRIIRGLRAGQSKKVTRGYSGATCEVTFARERQ